MHSITHYISPPPRVEKPSFPPRSLLFSKPTLSAKRASLRRPVVMPPFYELSVASFDQPSSSKPKWAIAVVFSPSSRHSLVYQIAETASGYSLDAPQSVTLNEGENGYRGKVAVGSVDSEKLHQLHSTLTSIPVVHGSPANSHSWVMEGILALRKLEGYHIDKQVTARWVSERLGEK